MAETLLNRQNSINQLHANFDRHLLFHMLKTEQLIHDEIPCFYVCQIKNSFTSTLGLLAATSLQAMLRNKIVKHERVYFEKANHQVNLFAKSGIQINPVILTYKNVEQINTLLYEIVEDRKPNLDFALEDGNQYLLWVINEGHLIKQIINFYAQVSKYYIADGHHRLFAISELFSRHSLDGWGDCFLAFLAADTQLILKSYDKLVRDLHDHSVNSFLEALTTHFAVEPLQHNKDISQIANACKMYINQQWYLLRLQHGSLAPIAVNDYVFNRILGIQARTIEERTCSVAQNDSLIDMEKKVNSGAYKIGFCFNPLRISDVFDVADTNEILPPSTTRFEPKLPNGIINHFLGNPIKQLSEAQVQLG